MAAAGHEVDVIGTLRMTVRAGGLAINKRPFLVVRNLIVPFIGGGDFLSQLGTQTWDWENKTRLVCGCKLRLESMHRNSSSIDSPRKLIQSCMVIVTNDVRVQPGCSTMQPKTSCPEHGVFTRTTASAVRVPHASHVLFNKTG